MLIQWGGSCELGFRQIHEITHVRVMAHVGMSHVAHIIQGGGPAINPRN